MFMVERRQNFPQPSHSVEDALMRGQRFGSKIKLPSTIAIKHQLLTMMFEDEIRAIPPGGTFNENESPALAMLKRLRGSPLERRPAGRRERPFPPTSFVVGSAAPIR